VRIAWIGPVPAEQGGARFVGTQLLQGLARAGAEVDCFLPCRPNNLPPSLFAEPRISLHCFGLGWEWGRWYSRTPLVSFFSGNLARARAQFSLADEIARRHERRPYDVLYQFSQTEMVSLRRRAGVLPPIVVHPSTHAAGELRWHRREAALSRRCEPLRKRAVVRAMLTARAAVQRRDIHLATRVLGVSRVFTDHLGRDYRIPPERLGVVHNPVDLARFRPGDGAPAGGPLELLYVSRMSARKGVELIVDLSHRLADLEGRVLIRAIGGCTSWSDYRPLLEDLHPGTAVYQDHVDAATLGAIYRGAGAVLQPSRFEPFGLTVAEGLASGTPAVASDEVGAVDGVDGRVCRVFPNGDRDAFEREVRALVAELEGDSEGELAALARAEAERLFDVDAVTATLVEELGAACGRERAVEVRVPVHDRLPAVPGARGAGAAGQADA
jgi:glycosyltransferase involved in cell wall biosynthesis